MAEISDIGNVKYISGVSQYNIDVSDDVLYVNTIPGPITLVLPNIAGSGLQGQPKIFYVNDYNNNAGTNNINIIGAGGNTVNGGLLSQNGVVAQCTPNGQTNWLIITASETSEGTIVSAGIVAHPGGGQGSAVLLTAQWNRVDYVATDHDSVMVNANLVVQTVNNTSAHILDIYPPASGSFFTTSAQAPNAVFSLAPGQVVTFVQYYPNQFTVD